MVIFLRDINSFQMETKKLHFISYVLHRLLFQKKLENYVFAVLSDLVKLDLSHCGLISIQPRAFSGLDSLEWLHLNDNQLNALHPTALLPLKAIHGLHLHSNPWNCSCGLRPTIEWMQE